VTTRRDAGWALAIFIAVSAFYLVTSSREPAWGDARGMWEVAMRISSDGAIDIKTRWPDDIPKGRNGKYYGIAPIGPSLVHVPGALIAHAIHEVDPKWDGPLRPLAVHLAPSLLGGLACALFFLLLRDLGIRIRVASACAAIMAVATTTWVYARMPYSEILQLTTFLGWFRAVLRVSALPADIEARVVRREGLWLGAWAGFLLNAKYVFASAILGGAVVIAWTLWKQRRQQLVRLIGWAAVTGGPLLILALAYNYLRWGRVTATGYEPYLDAYFGGSLFDGAWGMLASPNKSAFLYSPPLVLAAISLPRAVRAVPRLGFALVAMVLPVFLIYSTYRSWSGDYAWGPRFFVWAVPVVLIPLAWFVDSAVTRLRKAILVGVVALGFVVQVLGSSLYWDHFIRIAIEVKNQWLGNPNRAGSYIAERGRGHCDSCFEDTYELLWTPAFHPIRGHWWLLKSLARGDTAASAQRDAPWRHYTKLPMKLERYAWARIDWWGLLWLEDAKYARKQGVIVLVGLLAMLAFGIWRWLCLHRAAT